MANDINSDPELENFRSWLNGAFYQTWDLDEEGGMVGIVDREFGHSKESADEVIGCIDKLIKYASSRPDVSATLSGFTGDYDPSYDVMEILEWLILLKQYLAGNKTVFEFLTQYEPPTT